MMTVINTNTAAINAQYNLSKVQNSMDDAMSALSSGKRINSAGDDAAGLSIATRMESQVRGLNQAMRNAADGQSMIDTAEGAMDEISNMLQRMRELSIQAANDTNTSIDREALDKEVAQLSKEIDRVVSTTTFNGQNLLSGVSGLALQIGSEAGESLTFNINDMSTSSLGSLTNATSVGNVTSASFAGTQAKPTETQLTFNGNDSYEFALTYDVGGGSTETVAIKADVIGGSAKDVVDQINAAIRDTDANGSTEATRHINATYSGSTVTIENTYGGAITVAKNAGADFAQANSTIAFTSLSEAGGSNLVLGDNAQYSTSFSNNGATGTPVTPATFTITEPNAGLTDEKAATKASVSLTEGADNTADDVYEIVLDDGAGNQLTVTTAAVTATTADAALTALKTAFDALSDKEGFTMGDVTDNALEISRADGVNFTVKLGANDASTAALQEDVSATPADLDTTGVTTTDGVEGEDITYEVTLTAGSTSLTLNHTMENDGDYTADSVTAGTLTQALATQFANLTDDQKAGFKIDTTTAGALKFTRDDGVNFRVDYGANHNAGYILEDGSAASDATDAIASTGAISTDGTVAVGDGTSRMHLQINGADDYTFNIAGEDTSAGAITAAIGFTYDGTEGDLGNVASKIENLLNASDKFGASNSAHSFEVSVEDGLVVITDNLGKGFDLNSFTSGGSGRIAASNPAGQTPSGGSGAVILDDVNDGQTTATTTAAGSAEATAVKMSFNEEDNFSFTISDGTATAVISNVTADDDGSATGGLVNMTTAINDAIKRAGLSDYITATNTSTTTDAYITLTSTEGREISIENFKSTDDATLMVEAIGTNNTGISRFLDDGSANGSEVIANISLATKDGATSALEIIDRALEDVSAERSDLGAISNRLDHTISNLGNIVVNTEASQSRIEDADFAKVTGDLTKAQIMSQAATAMLAQANASKQSVLSLLQG